jgi:dTDP-4-dehydrorhamnose reductase
MSHKKIALVGPTGIVGEAILEILIQETANQWDLVAFSNREFAIETDKLKEIYIVPLTDFKSLRKKILEEKPNVIINAVGISDRKFCEGNKQVAWQINVQLVEQLVSVSKILNAHLITFSCEDVFDGGSGPYLETDKPNPKSYLGKSKLAAENFVITNINYYTVIRLPLVYGVSALGRKDFVARTIDSLKNGALNLENNYFTNPILAEDVAWGVMKVIERELTGILHFGGFDYVLLDLFVKKIAKFFGLDSSAITFPPNSTTKKFGLEKSYAEALLSIKFSSISEGLITYKYLDMEDSSDFEVLMNY